MAYAKQCDRCGNYYKKNYYKTETLIGYRASEDTSDSIKFITISTVNNTDKSFDLCDDCLKLLSYFLSNKKIIKFEGVI